MLRYQKRMLSIKIREGVNRRDEGAISREDITVYFKDARLVGVGCCVVSKMSGGDISAREWTSRPASQLTGSSFQPNF